MNAPADFTLRHDWTLEEIVAIHNSPLLELVARASALHGRFFDPNDVQKAALLSIKTGGCPEDCAYCPQSAHHREIELDRVELMQRRRSAGRRRAGAAAGADPFLHGRGLARGPRRASASTRCWRWCAACARSAWRPASRSAC